MCQVPVIFLSTCLHFLSCSFLFILLACCLSLPFLSFLSTCFLHHSLLANQRKHALGIWIQGFPLTDCTACHKLYSVHLSSRRVRFQCYLPFNLPSLSFIFLSFRFAGMLSLPSHFACLTVSFIILYWLIKENMHLEFGFSASPLSTALPAINSTQRTVWLTMCQVPVIFLSTCLHFLSCSFLFVLLACCLSLPFLSFLSTCFLHHSLLANQRNTCT